MEKVHEITDHLVESIAALAQQKNSGVEIVQIPNSIVPGDLINESPAILINRDGKGNSTISSLETVLAPYRARPTQRTGTAQATTLASFIDLTNRHKGGNSAIFVNADWRNPSLLAVIDYHVAQTDHTATPVGDDVLARFCKHRVAYQFPLSESWKQWTATSREFMGQGDFAAFLDDHIHEISSPTESELTYFKTKHRSTLGGANEIYDLSRGLEINVESVVKSRTKTQSGETQVVFETSHRDAAGGEINVPGGFMLDMPVFYEGEPSRIFVRLKYRPSSGGLLWAFELVRPDDIINSAVRQDLLTVSTETALPTYDGQPEF